MTYPCPNVQTRKSRDPSPRDTKTGNKRALRRGRDQGETSCN